MKVSIDKSKCAMCGTCVAICPEVFEMKDDGSVDVKKEFQGVEITDEQLIAKIKQAVDSCPSTAIVVEE
ncbi:ferredoxin [Candidatus Microgenomates bacterium]|jgi:ferredoxin|nr:ferredoxin [Candidatus Microgenomates bacterium]